MGFVYKITNTANGKIYIGKTEYSVGARWKTHVDNAKRSRLKHLPLYRAIRKYGASVFKVEIVEETTNTTEREMFWISQLNTYKYGYNATRGGEGRQIVDVIDVIETYNITKNISETADYLRIMRKTVSNVLHANKIDIAIKRYPRKVILLCENITFETCTEAAKFILDRQSLAYTKKYLAGKANNIVSCCKGNRRTALGFRWQYA